MRSLSAVIQAMKRRAAIAHTRSIVAACTAIRDSGYGINPHIVPSFGCFPGRSAAARGLSPNLIPQNPTLDNFRYVFTQAPFERYMFNAFSCPPR